MLPRRRFVIRRRVVDVGAVPLDSKTRSANEGRGVTRSNFLRQG
jgi:hypothetical protein